MRKMKRTSGHAAVILATDLACISCCCCAACNYTGPTDPASTKGWGTIDFDWSNWKGTGTAVGDAFGGNRGHACVGIEHV